MSFEGNGKEFSEAENFEKVNSGKKTAAVTAAKKIQLYDLVRKFCYNMRFYVNISRTNKNVK
ncbi:MAG: hypothetical protein ACI4MT_00390 [Christensenellales bacterium]